jgi:hypothetical protein
MLAPVTDPDSHTTNYVYNADNKETQTIHPSPDGSAPRRAIKIFGRASVLAYR